MAARVSSMALTLALTLAHAAASAQPEPAPDDVPAPAPLIGPDPTSAAPRAGTASGDREQYDAAFEALTRGDFPRAIAVFDRLAASADRTFAVGARELGRLARRLQAQQVRFVVAAGPTAAPTIRRVLAEDDRPSSGRVGFVVSTTLAGFYGGIAVVDLLDIDDFRAGTLVITGATGVAFVASFLGSRDRDIRAGVADAYWTGLALGLSNGLLLASPLGLDDDSEQVLGLGLAGLALGGATGLLLADNTRPTVAQSSLVQTTSLLGLATTGFGMILVADDENLDVDTVLLLLAGGLDAGAAVGIALAPRITWSKSRARLASLGMFLGGLAGFGASALIVGEPDDRSEGRVMAAATLGGLYGGFGLTVRLTRDMEPDPRYTTSEAPLVIMPTAVRGGGGLAVSGSF